MTNKRLVVVSNRLPVSVEMKDAGPRITPSAGGLVTALGAILRDRGGLWVGWLGTEVPEPTQLLARAKDEVGYALHPVPLTRQDVEGFYQGFANEVIWPLFHDFVDHCNFDPAYWPAYQAANRKFAQAVAESTGDRDYVWIHDYHLMLVARELRSIGVERELGYFLHIPFPAADVFVKLPWRQQIIEALLQFGVLGFQTRRDLGNFMQCVRRLVPEATLAVEGDHETITIGGRVVRVGCFPISIDYNDFLQRSVDDSVSELVAATKARMPGRQLILGLDRLDYSKGIPARIRAFANALERFPELCGNVTLLQVVVPSRTRVGEYLHLKDEIDRLVGAVNGRFAHAGWTPIQYIFRRLEDVELMAYYRVCGVALITPLKDGMNLVAKEYCACSIEDDGVLILSEFAGAAAQLGEHALSVNPFDIEAVADAVHRAVTMDDPERHRRMKALRAEIRDHTIFEWVDDFLGLADLAARKARLVASS